MVWKKRKNDNKKIIATVLLITGTLMAIIGLVIGLSSKNGISKPKEKRKRLL